MRLSRLTRGVPSLKSAALLLLGAHLALGAGDPVSRPKALTPEEAAKKGRELVAEILAQRPATNSVINGTIRVREGNGKRSEVRVQARVSRSANGWQEQYVALGTNGSPSAFFTIVHLDNGSAAYWLDRSVGSQAETNASPQLAEQDTMQPFAGSDFWLADLARQFFNWPDQRLVKSEMRKSRSCRVLESVNPHPAPGAYSRVLSWIDLETDGIVMAEAYDINGKLLKEFEPKDFKKVNGQWQLEEVRMYNDQTDSTTWINFDVGGK